MMEKNITDEKLDALFQKARDEKPIVSLEEVRPVLLLAKTGSSASNNIVRLRWMMLAFGLIIIAGFAIFLTNKETPFDKADSLAEKNVATSGQNTSESSAAAASENNTAPLPSQNKSRENSPPISSNPRESLNESYYFPGKAEIEFEENNRQIKMVMDEQLVFLSINNQEIAPEEYSNHAEIIDKGFRLKLKSVPHSAPANHPTAKSNKEVMDGLIDALAADQLIQPDSSFEFRLTGKKLYIDNTVRDDLLYRKYRNLYEHLSGNKIAEDTDIRIKH